MKVDNKIMAQFQMLGSRIVSINLKNDFLSANCLDSGKKWLDLSHAIVGIDQQEDNSFLGVIQLHVAVRIKEEKQKYSLKIILEGGFYAPEEMGKEGFERMLSINGLAALYGIARAQVRSISSQVFADGGVLLPMIDVTRYSKILEKTSECSQ